MKLLLTVLATARLLASAELTLPQLLPPDARFVIGIRVRSLTESPLFRDSGSATKSLSEGWLKQAAFTGFDPFRDVDEAWIATLGDGNNPPSLLLLRGRFHPPPQEAGARQYRGFALTGTGQGAAGLFAPLDAETAICGDPAAVRAAIDRLSARTPPDPALAARATALNRQFEIWGTGARPEGFTAPAGPPAQFDAIDRFEFGVRLTSGLEVSAEFHVRAQADAAKLATSFDGLKTMFQMAMQQNSAAQARGAEAAKLDIQHHADTWKIAFSISEAELQQAIAAQRATLAATLAATPAVSAAKPAPRPLIVTGGEVAAPSPAGESGTIVVTLPRKQ